MRSLPWQVVFAAGLVIACVYALVGGLLGWTGRTMFLFGLPLAFVYSFVTALLVKNMPGEDRQ